jgi:hypothetical protein
MTGKRPEMFASIGGLWRAALIVSLALMVTACSGPIGVPMGPGPPGIRPSTVGTLGKAPVTGVAASFAFAAVTGMPAELRFAMQDALKIQGATRNLKLLPEGDPSATYIVRGYLSAIGDENGILLVYTWDVLDRGGNRLHRVSGQESGNGSLGDPWASVTREMVLLVALQTIDDLSDWVRA